MNILDTIAENTRQRYKEIIKNKPLAKVKAEALEMPKGNFEFERRLAVTRCRLFARLKRLRRQRVLLQRIFLIFK